jgi:hypothetical protein
LITWIRIAPDEFARGSAQRSTDQGCVIRVPEPKLPADFATLGHELYHCFEKDFHPTTQRWGWGKWNKRARTRRPGDGERNGP